MVKQKSIMLMMGVFGLCLVLLIVSLFNLTVLKGTSYAETGESNATRTLTITAKRGSILDSSGVPLAYDKTSYNITFSRDPLQTGEKWRAIYTDIILETIEILEENGNEVIDTLSIRRDENGEYYYYWGAITNEEALAAREKLWRDNMYMPTADADKAFQILRQRYMIPDELDYETAHKVLSIWQEVQNYAFKSYVSVVIAYDVDASSVAEITQRSLELLGMSAVQTYTRVYPNGSVAAHILGYMSKVYDEDWLTELKESGYSSDDLVGVTGVESTMEEELSSNIGTRKGSQTVEIDSRSSVVRVLEQTDPTPGNDVVLTIDADLQKVVEEALADNVEYCYNTQLSRYNSRIEYYQKLEENRGGTATRFAKMGAAIVMDVNTGQVLALASYPSYDPNLFTGGISEEDYAVLNDEESTPLFNKAISSRAEPGSIFKMVTGYAGLMEGVITPEETIDCQGDWDKDVTQGDAPSCWVSDPSRHANENITTALKDSCNYYFFTVTNRLGIDKLNKWADIFGLTSKTGIELPLEVKGYVANQKVLYDNTKDIDTGQVSSKAYLVRNAIARDLKAYGVLRGVFYTDEQVDMAATRIVELVGTGIDETGPYIRAIMREELGIPESVTYSKLWHLEISSRLYEITWNPIQTVLTGIGQSVSSVTPIAVARYISAIANGGTVYEASIIKRVVAADGTILLENNPEVVAALGDTYGYLEYIQEGMCEVISAEDGGTAADAFVGFEYVEDMAAKTGTAQVSSIDLENTAWFVAYTPIENAEIAVVIYIPNGYSGAMAAQAARDIIQYYRDRQVQQVDAQATKPGNLVE